MPHTSCSRPDVSFRPSCVSRVKGRCRRGRLLPVLLLALASCCFVANRQARAQNVQHTSKSADLGLRSSLKVNPATYGLELEIPLGGYPGRAGNSVPVTIFYSSKLWRFQYSGYNPDYGPSNEYGHGESVNPYTIIEAKYGEYSRAGWTMSIGMPFIDQRVGPQEWYTSAGYPVGSCDPANSCFSIDRMLIHMPDGSSHELRSQDDPKNCSVPTPCSWPDDMYAVDGSRVRYQKSTQTLFMPDGARYLLGSSQYVDRNGNVMTLSNGAWTDTLGRAIPLPPLSSTAGNFTYSLPGVGGSNINYTFVWKNLGDQGVLTTPEPLRYISDRYPGSLTAIYSPYLFYSDTSSTSRTNFGNGAQIFNPVVLNKIILPTGQAYTFTYNIYGEIDKVVYPTGGYERYTYGGAPSVSPAHGVYSQANRGVALRYVSAKGDGSDEGAPWQFGVVNAKDPAIWGITAPDGTVTQSFRYTDAGTSALFGYSFEEPRAAMPYEERVYSAPDPADNNNRHLLRRTLTEWTYTGTGGVDQGAQKATRNTRVTKRVEILLDTGGDALAKTTTYGYDTTYQFTTGANQTSVNEYDYVAIPQATAQTGDINSIPVPAQPVRRTETAYLDSSNASYRARNILGLAASVTVKDGTGAVLSQTLTNYDEPGYQLGNTYGAVTGWSDPSTSVRGNVTTVSMWHNIAGTFIQTHAKYDQCGSVVAAIDANNNQTLTDYSSAHAFAYPTSVTTAAPNPDSVTGGGVTYGPGTFGSIAGFTTYTSYDPATGMVVSTTDANGKTTTLNYSDPLNRLKMVTRPDGGATVYDYGRYNNAGRVSDYVAVTTSLDATRSTVSYQYFDGLGRPDRSFVHEGGSPATYLTSDTQYDVMGRVWRVSNPYRASGSDQPINPSGLWTTTEYDALGRVAKVKTPDDAVMTTSYAGNTVTVSDQRGRKRSSVSDALGRLTQVTEDPTSGGLNYVTSYTYDALGNLRKVDQGGQLRFFMYDSLSRLIREKHPEQSAGSVVSNITDSVTGNSQWSTAYGYDDAGNVTVRVDARDITTNYTYDHLNRNVITHYSGGATTTPDVFHHYDNPAAGKNGLARPWWNNTDTTANGINGYDAAGRVLEQHQNFLSGGVWSAPFSEQFQYNLAGGVTTQTYPSGHKVEYQYDAAGRLGDNGASPALKGTLGDGMERVYASQVLYDERGALSQEMYGTDTPVYNKHFYNVRGQLSEIRVSTYPVTSGDPTNWNRGALINHYSDYSWAGSGTDNNGNLKKQDVYIPNDDQISGYSLTTFFYDYDALNRLQLVREGRNGTDQWWQQYDYDRWGNRTVNANGTWGGVPEPQFEVEQATNRLYAPGDSQRSPASKLMRYDAAGNLAYDGYTGAGSRSYDAENRMTSAEFVSGQTQTASYVYDGGGLRVKRLAGTPGEVWQVYGAGGEILAEYAANASPTQPQKEYGYRNGELLVTATGAPPPPQQQQRVNVAAAANGAAATASTSYDAYGLSAATAINGSRTYSGLYWNDQTAGALPDWLQVSFAGAKTVGEVDVFFLQDNYGTAEPTEATTFTQYGVTAFDVQYWSGSQWVTVPGGGVTGNNRVWRRFTFTPVNTDKIRVVVNGSTDMWSRIVEVEAYEGTASSLGTEVNWLVADQLGTPRMVFDKTGSLSGVSRHDYLPFGEEAGAGLDGRTTNQGYSEYDGVRQQFTGKERDIESGLDYFGARYYSSPQGRFTGVDPLNASAHPGNPQTWNRYAYVLNNPLAFVDPDGNVPQLAKGRNDGSNIRVPRSVVQELSKREEYQRMPDGRQIKVYLPAALVRQVVKAGIEAYQRAYAITRDSENGRWGTINPQTGQTTTSNSQSQTNSNTNTQSATVGGSVGFDKGLTAGLSASGTTERQTGQTQTGQTGNDTSLNGTAVNPTTGRTNALAGEIEDFSHNAGVNYDGVGVDTVDMSTSEVEQKPLNGPGVANVVQNRLNQAVVAGSYDALNRVERQTVPRRRQN